MPLPPNAHAVAVLALTAIALYLFTRDRIPLESSSLVVLAILAIGFQLFPYTSPAGETLNPLHFFHGFGHEALVAVCALMVAGQGLVRTGALEPIGRTLARMWGRAPVISLLVTLVIAAALSAFVNNTPIVVLLLPILISVSLRTQTRASDVLMPMGFATLLGGMATTIGTSTNLLVVSVAADLGERRMEMFDFFVPAIMAGGIGLLYLWLVAPRLIPHRRARMSDTSPRVFTAHLKVGEDSYAAGRTLAEISEKVGRSLKVHRIQRGPDMAVMPLPDATVMAGDLLVIRDTPDRLKEYEEVLGGALYSGTNLVSEDQPLRAEDQQIAEIVVTQASPLANQTLNDIRFTEQYQLVTLAFHRVGWPQRVPQHRNIGDIVLRSGDLLLVQGPREQIAGLKRGGEFLVLDATADLPHTRRAPLALGIMAGIVVAAGLGFLPIAIAALCGVLLMLVTGCLSWRDTARALSTQVIMIIVVSLALGMALIKTGGADYVARLFVNAAAGASPPMVLSGLIFLMAVLTNVVSNNAAAVIGTPIAVSIAHQLGVPAEPFVLAVLFGANMSYATPMAYQTNLLVMNAGGYTFGDFVRVGAPFSLLMWGALSWILPARYGMW